MPRDERPRSTSPIAGAAEGVRGGRGGDLRALLSNDVGGTGPPCETVAGAPSVESLEAGIPIAELRGSSPLEGSKPSSIGSSGSCFDAEGWTGSMTPSPPFAGCSTDFAYRGRGFGRAALEDEVPTGVGSASTSMTIGEATIGGVETELVDADVETSGGGA